MNVSASGLALIRQFEGLQLTAYPDGNGFSIGYGHSGASPGQTITPDDAEYLFLQDVHIAASAVASAVTVPLTQNQFDALVSLVYNWGANNFRASLLLQRLNAGDYEGAAQRLSEHPITSGGKVLQGLVNRRAAEAALFRSGGTEYLTATPTESNSTEAALLVGAAALIALLVFS